MRYVPSNGLCYDPGARSPDLRLKKPNARQPGQWSAVHTDTLTPTPTDTHTPTYTPIPTGPVTIDYVYDPLYRLMEANYSTGDYYHYAYDAVGNRRT